LSTKIHLLADTECRPLVRLTTAGQRHDSLAFEPLMSRLKVLRSGPGRPRTRPDRLLADKAYSNRTTRAHLRRRGIIATIPEKTDQQKARAVKGSAGGRPPVFDTEAYKRRNTVERAINKLKDFRAVASAARSTSPRSRSGCATPPTKIRETLPSAGEEPEISASADADQGGPRGHREGLQPCSDLGVDSQPFVEHLVDAPGAQLHAYDQLSLEVGELALPTPHLCQLAQRVPPDRLERAEVRIDSRHRTGRRLTHGGFSSGLVCERGPAAPKPPTINALPPWEQRR
jgi:transposase